MAEVKIPPVLRAATAGLRSEHLDGETVGQVLDLLAQRHPELRPHLFAEGGDLNRYLNVYINDEDVRVLEGLRTQVAPADTIVLLPAMTRDGTETKASARENPFVNRLQEQEIFERAVAAAEEDGSVPVIVVTGAPGIGKTALLRQVVSRFGHRYPDGVIWLNMAEGADLASDRLFSALGVSDAAVASGARPSRSQALAQYQEQVAERRAMIVFDNAERADRGALQPLVPRRGRSCVLIASRGEVAVPGAVRLILNEFEPVDVREFLRVVGVEPSLRELDGIERLGGNPARLQTFAQLLKIEHVTPAEATEQVLQGPDAEPPDDEPRGFVRAGYVSDAVADDDQLGIGGDVDALASLVAARDTVPPLSLGLFGDWGTGKTFFMRALESRIKALAELSRKAERRGDETAYCSEIRQIKFNAWHYVDANLWASLVTRIWEGLADSPGEQAPIAERLTTSKLAVTELENARRAADNQKRSAEEELARLKDDVRRKNDELARVRDGSDATLGPDTRPEARDESAEWPTTSEADVEIESLALELSALRGRLRWLWRRVRVSTRRQRAWLAVGALGIVVLVASLAVLPGAISAIGAIASAAAAVAGLVAGFKAPLADFRETAATANSLAARVEHEARAARRSREIALEEELADLKRHGASLQGHVEAAEQRIRRAQRQIEDIRSGRRPYKFIAERLESADYERHLGIMALIRRDFESLADLLRESREQRTRAAGATGEIPRIDRVVLYVDDLDRCPASRVVEVLEAVHLLLAFDLFVVVVGVDARWLLRSLSHHYAGELSPGSDGLTTNALDWRSTPQNYLEKIFQIPFALRPMDSAGYARLLESMFSVEVSPGSSSLETLDPDRSESVQQPAVQDAEPRAARASSGERSPKQPEQEAAREIDLNPTTLRITQPELDLMKELLPLLRTPRAAKRMANTYRLLRASLDSEELAMFIQDADYAATQVLLAVMIGFPLQADELFRDLLRSAPASVFDLLRTTDARLSSVVESIQKRDLVPGGSAAFARWAPRVARYSFSTARLDH